MAECTVTVGRVPGCPGCHVPLIVIHPDDPAYLYCYLCEIHFRRPDRAVGTQVAVAQYEVLHGDPTSWRSPVERRRTLLGQILDFEAGRGTAFRRV